MLNACTYLRLAVESQEASSARVAREGMSGCSMLFDWLQNPASMAEPANPGQCLLQQHTICVSRCSLLALHVHTAPLFRQVKVMARPMMRHNALDGWLQHCNLSLSA